MAHTPMNDDFEFPGSNRERFLHHLHDTLILLGAGSRFAGCLDEPDAITAKNVEDLRQYNMRLIDSLKGKLVGIHKIVIEVQEPEEPQ